MENKNKISFEMHNYLDVEGDPDEVINKILRKITDLDDIGYAGHLEKKWLKMTLERLILDKDGDNQQFSYKKEFNKKIKLISDEVINKCEKYIEDRIHIFLFPTLDKFARERMKGVSGYCPWKNTILIFINFVKGWENQLKETIVHELAHALSPFAEHDAPLGHWLILEGIAENFKDFIFPECQSDWTKAISEEESKEILAEIKHFLHENDFEKYSEVFFGTGKYALWSGYSIGYFLVKKYLEKQKTINWKEVLKVNPEEILESRDD